MSLLHIDSLNKTKSELQTARLVNSDVCFEYCSLFILNIHIRKHVVLPYMQQFRRIYWLSTHILLQFNKKRLPENMNNNIEYVDVQLTFCPLSNINLTLKCSWKRIQIKRRLS